MGSGQRAADMINEMERERWANECLRIVREGAPMKNWVHAIAAVQTYDLLLPPTPLGPARETLARLFEQGITPQRVLTIPRPIAA